LEAGGAGEEFAVARTTVVQTAAAETKEEAMSVKEIVVQVAKLAGGRVKFLKENFCKTPAQVVNLVVKKVAKKKKDDGPGW
jgi:hypothetical protein